MREAIRAEAHSFDAATRPWTRGWKSARAFRRASRIPMREPFRLDGVAPWTSLASDAPLPGGAESVVAWKAGHSAVRKAVRFKRTKVGRMHSRFASARDLYFVAFGAPPDRDYARVVSNRIAGASSVANAFAAELLAPRELVKDQLKGVREVDWFAISEIAARLDAPAMCVRHQIENNDLAVLADAL